LKGVNSPIEFEYVVVGKTLLLPFWRQFFNPNTSNDLHDYHVVSGNVTAKQVMKVNGRTVKTLEGASIKVRTMHGVTVDDTRVTKTDIQASNGVIHVIDTVLMPKM